MTKDMSYKDAVIEFQRSQADMSHHIDGKLEVIISNQSKVLTRMETHGSRLDRHEGQIDQLKTADKRVTGIAAALAAIGSSIALWLNR